MNKSDSPFPMYTYYDDETPIPADPIAYVVAQGGAFRVVNTAVFQAVVPAKGLPMLGNLKQQATLLLPKVPPHQVAQLIAFFRDVWDRYATEVTVLLAYNAAEQAYTFVVPSQKTSAGKCDYDVPRDADAPPGCKFVGTVHSHGSLPAFHSGTDQHDEKYADGVHATIGYVDAHHVQVVASLACGGERFTLDPRALFGGLALVGPPGSVPYPFTEEFLASLMADLVKEHGAERFQAFLKYAKVRTLAQYFATYGTERADGVARGGEHAAANRFRLELPPGMDPAACAPDPAWIEAVTPFAVVKAYRLLTTSLEKKKAPAGGGDADAGEDDADADAPTTAARSPRVRRGRARHPRR